MKSDPSYSRKLVRDLTERCAFLAVSLKDYKQACVYYKELCKLQEALYGKSLQPTVAIQLYTLGKLMSLVGDPDCLATLSRACDLLSMFFGASYEG